MTKQVAPLAWMADGATGEQRLQMLRLSARGLKMAEVSDIELKREGKSYTADTIAQLR